MDFRYIKSLVWLVGFSSLGYALIKITAPSEDYAKQLEKDYFGVDNTSEIRKKKQSFASVLQASVSSEKPMYRMTKEEIEKELKK